MSTWKRRLSLAPFFLLALTGLLFFRVRLRYDAHHYYEPLRSLLLDGDINTYNEREYVTNPYWHGWDIEGPGLFAAKPAFLGFMTHPEFTSRGYEFLFFPLGWAALMAPSTALADLAVKSASLLKIPVFADGYSYPYLFVSCWWAFVYGALGLGLAYRLCARYFAPAACAFALSAVILLHNVIPFMAADGLYSHAQALFLISLYLLLWDDLQRSNHLSHAFIFGLTGGWLVITRYQELPLLLIPIIDALRSCRDRAVRGQRLKQLVVFMIGMVPCCLLQATTWKILHGAFLVTPRLMGTADLPTFDPFCPHLFEMWFSNQHGFLSWTPFMLLAVLGIAALMGRSNHGAPALSMPVPAHGNDEKVQAGCLHHNLFSKQRRVLGCHVLLQFMIQTYYDGCRSEWWNLGFGIRRYANYAVFFMLGFAALYAACNSRWLKGLLLMSVMLGGIWNLTFMTQFYDGLTIHDHGPYYQKIVGKIIPYQQYEYGVVFPDYHLLPDMLRAAIQFAGRQSEAVRAVSVWQNGNPRGLYLALAIVAAIVGGVAGARRVADGSGTLLRCHWSIIIAALLPLGFTSWLAIGHWRTKPTAVAGANGNRHETRMMSRPLHAGARFVGFNQALPLEQSQPVTIALPAPIASTIAMIFELSPQVPCSGQPAIEVELRRQGGSVWQKTYSLEQLYDRLGQGLLIPADRSAAARLAFVEEPFSEQAIDQVVLNNVSETSIKFIALSVK